MLHHGTKMDVQLRAHAWAAMPAAAVVLCALHGCTPACEAPLSRRKSPPPYTRAVSAALSDASVAIAADLHDAGAPLLADAAAASAGRSCGRDYFRHLATMACEFWVRCGRVGERGWTTTFDSCCDGYVYRWDGQHLDCQARTSEGDVADCERDLATAPCRAGPGERHALARCSPRGLCRTAEERERARMDSGTL